MKKERNLAFVVELLLLFVLLLLVIVVITKTLMTSRSRSLHARALTEAVCLAEEVAEVTASAEDRADACVLLGKLEQVSDLKDQDGQTTMNMIFSESNRAGGPYRVEILWDEEMPGKGTFVSEDISVYRAGDTGPLYTLHTGRYR